MASWFCEMGGEREGGRRREKRKADKKEQMMGKGRAQWSDDKRDKLKMWMRSEKKWWVGGCGCGCMIGLTLFFFAWSFYSLLCCLNKQKLFFNLDWVSEERQRQVHRKNIEWFCRGDVLLCYLFLSLTSVASRMHPLALLT